MKISTCIWNCSCYTTICNRMRWCLISQNNWTIMVYIIIITMSIIFVILCGSKLRIINSLSRLNELWFYVRSTSCSFETITIWWHNSSVKLIGILLKSSLTLTESSIWWLSKKILAKEWSFSRHCSNISISLDDPYYIFNHRLFRVSFSERLELWIICTVPNFHYVVIVDSNGFLIDFERAEFPS